MTEEKIIKEKCAVLPPSNAKPFPRTINNQNVSNCVLSQVGKK
jgi:hypothetical protein